MGPADDYTEPFVVLQVLSIAWSTGGVSIANLLPDLFFCFDAIPEDISAYGVAIRE